ncbi:TPA: ATP-binding protein [Clostridium perfringens]
MRETRPNPQKILKEINKNEKESKRGKLKIFFGYAAGVGKTYAMLEAAHSAIAMGLDVVVGYIEPHTRPETLALLEGLELLPNLEVAYRGLVLREFNLDLALSRKPDLIIVDELAHTNVKGLRHEKRYSDIEELLDAGIDVYTTLNVQHIESLNDVVASITNIVVKERIPDRIFKNAFQNEKFKANLLRAVSHDLRTPLTSISGSASLLLNNNFDEETKRKLTLDIYDDSIWLINLVENLLSVSRIDNGNINLNREAQLVEEIILEALQHVHRNACDYNIEIDLKDELLMVNADVRLIIQVIINIVDNAIKYTEKGSNIKISAFSKGDNVIIEIADNGVGINKEDKEHIFDMFFTSKKNISDSRRGLGLGLALCKSIINVNEGEIYVRDNKPRGTIIGFSLQRFEVNKNETSNFSY